MNAAQVKAPKKLIEVALPLDDINREAAREKSIRHGHPSTLHLWWARRPLAAARAVIFAQLVNDPSWRWELEHPGEIPPNHLKATWAKSRKRLFALLSELVKWENTTNEELLDKARAEIRKSWVETCEVNADHPDAATLFDPEKLPGLHDPFAGGGAIPLEAQRLGLEAYASDLNPVAVLINKAMIEIPPKFAGLPPVHPDAQNEAKLKTWKGAQGLAEDVRRYGAWMRDEAEKRIGHLYPKAKITPEMVKERLDLNGLEGKELTVIAWLWARTVKSPSPAFRHVDVPLVSSFVLATKPGKEAWVEPIVEGDAYRFVVRTGKPPATAKEGTKASGRGANFRCVLSGAAIDGDYIKAEAQGGRMGARMLAIVAEGQRARIYLDPIPEHEAIATSAEPSWRPDVEFFQQALGFRVGNYGMTKWSDLFTARQLVALGTFSELVNDAVSKTSVSPPGYLAALKTYLSFALDKGANYWSSLCAWHQTRDGIVSTFGRQTVPMVWDFAEANPISNSSGNFALGVEQSAKFLEMTRAAPSGYALALNATEQRLSTGRVVVTDPPYYDNIGYADLSDFFYVWLRRSLGKLYPELFSTISTPKNDELVATPARHGGRRSAEEYFLTRMSSALRVVANTAHAAFPVSIFYAFKQSETSDAAGTASTGWETFLGAVIDCGLSIGGTWPVRTEYGNKETSRNALASSIVLVCRKRPDTAATISRREFLRELNAVLPEALDEMTKGAGDDRSPVAPVDLSQAIIGPGMAVFSKYAAVLEANGEPMSVKTALQLINRFLAEDDFDADTQFCLHWFEQYGWGAGAYGEADVLARAKATSVGGVDEAGVIESGAGKVRLLKWAEYPTDWDPSTDKRLPVWEALHHLIRALRSEGETGAAKILAVVSGCAEAIRQLAYRLYTLCERRGAAEDARAYNELVTSWTAIETAAASLVATPGGQTQMGLFEGDS